MPRLISKLKQDHQTIVEALQQAKDCGFSSNDSFERLMTVKTALFEHLAEEDQHLYPTLFEAAETDSALKATLGIFARDMQEVSREVTSFFDKHHQGGEGIEYAADFGRIYALLGQRIRKEEELLYPEYDKLTG